MSLGLKMTVFGVIWQRLRKFDFYPGSFNAQTSNVLPVNTAPVFTVTVNVLFFIFYHMTVVHLLRTLAMLLSNLSL